MEETRMFPGLPHFRPDIRWQKVTFLAATKEGTSLPQGNEFHCGFGGKLTSTPWKYECLHGPHKGEALLEPEFLA